MCGAGCGARAGSDTPDGSDEDAAFTTASRGLAEAAQTVLKTPTLLYVFAGGALISFGMNGIIGWAPSFMSRELGLSVGAVTLLLGKYGLIFGIAGTLAGGRDRGLRCGRRCPRRGRWWRARAS